MISIREQILASVTLLLTNAIADARVERSRTVPVERASTPFIRIKPGDETIDSLHSTLIDRRLNLLIEMSGRGDAPDQTLDPIAALAHKTLMADKTVGGLAIDIEEISREWDFQDADGNAGDLRVFYQVRYRTKRDDETLLP